MADGNEHLDRVRAQFDRQAEAYSQMAIVRNEKMLAAIADAARVGPEHRVLDLASGPGYLTMMLATRAREAIGVDATERFVEQARAEAARRGIANVSFELGDVARLRFEDGSFDAVTCKFAFHHFPRPEAVLAEMRRVARAGGTIVIADMVASEDPAQREYQDRIERLCDPSHASAIPASEFERMFTQHGLRVDAHHRRETSYTVDDWLLHGGPSAENEREIRALFEDSIEVDRSGLRVRRENGALSFSHQGATFVLKKA